MARLPFGGAGYHAGAFVRGVNLVENRLNEERPILVQEEERPILVQEEVSKPMAVTVCGKLRAFESERKAANEATAADASKSESDDQPPAKAAAPPWISSLQGGRSSPQKNKRRAAIERGAVPAPRRVCGSFNFQLAKARSITAPCHVTPLAGPGGWL